MKRLTCALLFIFMSTMDYAQVQYTSLSHYVFPEFTEGVILMKAGTRHDKLLNYNSLTEEMVFDNKGEKLAISPDQLVFIDTVFILDKKFVRVDEKFVELLYHGVYDVFAEHLCKVTPPGSPTGFGTTSQSTGGSSYATMAAQGGVYDLKLPDGYDIRPYADYWIRKDGVANKVTSMKQLSKLYPDKKAIMKAYIKEHNIKYGDQQGMVNLIKHLESD